MKIEVDGIYQIQEVSDEGVSLGFQRVLSCLPVGSKVRILRVSTSSKDRVHTVKNLESEDQYSVVSCYEGRLRPLTPEDPDIETDF